MGRDCTQESGQCSECRGYCVSKPGWFLPGEAEKVADHLGLNLVDLFKSKLAVDWWVGRFDDEDGDTFVLSPAIVSSPAGEEFPAEPHGRCVFFVGDKCSIHPVKPHECRVAWCGDAEAFKGVHEATAEAWSHHQNQIENLLGREPESESYSIFDMFGIGGW